MFKPRLSFIVIFLIISIINAFFTFQLEKNNKAKALWVDHTEQVILLTNKYLSNKIMGSNHGTNHGVSQLEN